MKKKKIGNANPSTQIGDRGRGSRGIGGGIPDRIIASGKWGNQKSEMDSSENLKIHIIHRLVR